MERRVTVIFTEEEGKREQIKIDAPDVTMEEAQVLLYRASNYIMVNLIRNTIMRDIAVAAQAARDQKAKDEKKVVLAGEGMIGIDPSRLRQ